MGWDKYAQLLHAAQVIPAAYLCHPFQLRDAPKGEPFGAVTTNRN